MSKQQPLGTEQAKNGKDVFSFLNSYPARLLASRQRKRAQAAPAPAPTRT